MSTDKKTLLGITVKLYRALNLMPCACTWRWISPTKEEIVKVCIRCKAMKEWEEFRSGLS